MKFTGWVVLILAIVLFLSGCGTGEDAPAQGAREWIDGVTNLDGNKILKYTCLAQRDNVKQASMWASAFSVLGQMFTNPNLKIEGDTSDLKFETVSREGNRAEVRVYGELRVAFSGVAEAHQIDERWQMVYENETWRWCSPITSVPPIAQTTSSSNQQSNTSPPSSTFTVYANQDWQDTGYSVGPETLIKIEYVSEQWSPWAGGFYDGQGFPGGDPYANNIVPGIHASLIARIGDNQPFFIGNKFAAITTPFHQPGSLFLRINDATLNDNSGSIDVIIEATEKPIQPITQVASPSQPSDISAPDAIFTVYANQGWQDTGYSVGPEFVMEIQYISGMWSPWAGGSYDGQGFPGGDPYANNIVPGIHASLIARIGDNPPFFVGNSFAATTIPSPSPYPGNLYLRINDTTLNDNSGSIDVGIRVAPKEK